MPQTHSTDHKVRTDEPETPKTDSGLAAASLELPLALPAKFAAAEASPPDADPAR